jgi:hypothetical protein
LGPAVFVSHATARKNFPKLIVVKGLLKARSENRLHNITHAHGQKEIGDINDIR